MPNSREVVLEGVKQILALIFVNLVPFFLDKSFLTVAISVNTLVLGISIQQLLSKSEKEKLDKLLNEMISMSKMSIEGLRALVETAYKQIEDAVEKLRKIGQTIFPAGVPKNSTVDNKNIDKWSNTSTIPTAEMKKKI